MLFTINEEFWSQALDNKLYSSFLTELDSHYLTICSGIAKEYIHPLEHEIDNRDEKNVTHVIKTIGKQQLIHGLLIPIIGASGSGKSTVLFQIAYELKDDFSTYLIRRSSDLDLIVKDGNNLLPGLILLDEIDEDLDLEEFNNILSNHFSQGHILVIAEQEVLWREFIRSTNPKYHYQFIITVRTKCTRERLEIIWSTLVDTLKKSNKNASKIVGKHKKIFLSKNSSNISDRILNLYISIGEEIESLNIPLAWDVWKKMTRNHVTLTPIFDEIAWLNKFNVNHDLFLLDELNKGDAKVLTSLITDSTESPILLFSSRDLRLRHKKISDWYFIKYPELEKLAIIKFTNRFKVLKSPLLARQFRYLRRSSHFKTTMGLTDLDCYERLKSFALSNESQDKDEKVKCYFECIKILYYDLGDTHHKFEAKRMLDAIQNKPGNELFSIALKINFALREKNFDAARQHVDELTKLRSDNIDSQVEIVRQNFRVRNFFRVLKLVIEFFYSKGTYNNPRANRYFYLSIFRISDSDSQFVRNRAEYLEYINKLKSLDSSNWTSYFSYYEYCVLREFEKLSDELDSIKTRLKENYRIFRDIDPLRTIAFQLSKTGHLTSAYNLIVEWHNDPVTKKTIEEDPQLMYIKFVGKVIKQDAYYINKRAKRGSLLKPPHIWLKQLNELDDSLVGEYENRMLDNIKWFAQHFKNYKSYRRLSIYYIILSKYIDNENLQSYLSDEINKISSMFLKHKSPHAIAKNIVKIGDNKFSCTIGRSERKFESNHLDTITKIGQKLDDAYVSISKHGKILLNERFFVIDGNRKSLPYGTTYGKWIVNNDKSFHN